jgi:hypothetical protein
MFKPGHLHRSSNQPGMPGGLDFSIDVSYEVRNDPEEGAMMHFKLEGTINGKAFVDEFDMHRDVAFNFASLLGKALIKHGFPANTSPIMRGHDEYDAMFDDIRSKLNAKPGEPVNLDHLD